MDDVIDAYPGARTKHLGVYRGVTPVDETIRPPLFENYYECPCGTTWYDIWSCACNDCCPTCDCEIEPTESVELTEIEGEAA